MPTWVIPTDRQASPELTLWGTIGESARRSTVLPMVEPSDTALRGSRPALPASLDTGVRARAGVDSLNETMNRYAQGDDAAFDELYRMAAPRVRSFLMRLGTDFALADDLTQEAFLRIHRARGSFCAGAAALPWILAIARNALRDSARRGRSRPTVRNSEDDEGAPFEASADGRGDEVLAAREMLAIVRTTLMQLPSLQREAFVLIRFEGLSVHDAAQVLGATEGAVKVRAFRAYEALRAALGQESARAG